MDGLHLRDVFSLRQLEDVLLSVNNGQSTVGIDLTNVTSVEPAVLINDFLTIRKRVSFSLGTDFRRHHLRLILHLVVTNEDGRASEADFTTRKSLGIGGVSNVVHFSDVNQLVLCTTKTSLVMQELTCHCC